MMLSNLFNKKTLLVAAAALGVLTVGVICLRPEQKHSTGSVANVVIPSATAGESVYVVQPTGVSYVGVEAMDIPLAQKQQLKQQIKQLQETGSSTGGVLTTEFKQATYAKMNYRFGRKQKLSFVALDVKSILPAEFVLTGRAYEGQASEAGFDEFYRLFENPTTKARLELSETKIHHDKPLVLVKELYNQEVHGTPVRLERLVDKKGITYHHAEFALGDKYIKLNTKGMSHDEVMTAITNILR